MKNTLLALTVLLLSLYTFANKNIDPPKESEYKTTVYVYRPRNFVGSGAVFNLKINGEKIGKIKNGKKIMLQLPLGNTKFKVRGKEVELKLKPGKTYYLRFVLVRNMFLGKLDLVAVTEEFAKTELKNIR